MIVSMNDCYHKQLQEIKSMVKIMVALTSFWGMGCPYDFFDGWRLILC